MKAEFFCSQGIDAKFTIVMRENELLRFVHEGDFFGESGDCGHQLARKGTTNSYMKLFCCSL